MNKEYIKESLTNYRELFKNSFLILLLLLTGIGVLIFSIIKSEIDRFNIVIVIFMVILSIVVFIGLATIWNRIEDLTQRINDDN